MKIEYSEHAELRIKNRKISKRRILKCLLKPDKIKSSFRNRKLYQLKLDDKILEVAARKEDKKLVVVTAYYLKED